MKVIVITSIWAGTDPPWTEIILFNGIGKACYCFDVWEKIKSACNFNRGHDFGIS